MSPDAATSETSAPDGVAEVLVVISDDAVRARAVSSLGLRKDLHVTAVTSIAEGRDLVARADVLVVDGDLRPKGGYSWLYELRESAELDDDQRPPALVLTDRSDDRFLVAWSGADASLPKPVDPFALARTVADLARPATTARA